MSGAAILENASMTLRIPVYHIAVGIAAAWIYVVCVGTVSVLAADPAPPAAPPVAPATSPAEAKPVPGARPLGSERWVDRTYGVTILTPVGLPTVNQVNDPDGYVMRMADDQEQLRMALALKRSNSKLTLVTVVNTAKEQMLTLQPSSQVLRQRDVSIPDHPAHAIYFRLPQAKGEDQFLAQGLVQIDAQTFAILEARSDITQADATAATFDAVLASTQITNLKEIDKQREAALSQGAKWRNGGGTGEGLTLKKFHAAIVPQQLFRLVSKTGEAGFMGMNQSLITRDGKPGVRIEIDSKIIVADSHFDTLADYFLADDDSLELWSITTTQRPAALGNALSRKLELNKPVAKDAPRDPNVRTSRETGIRTGNELSIIVENPDSPVSHHVYQVPRTGYLSQVEALMLPQLLPIDRPGTYGFYCYLSRRGMITFRTDNVTPALTGVAIETRVSPNEPALRTLLDSQRRLVDKQLSPGVRQIPSTLSELRNLWPGHWGKN